MFINETETADEKLQRKNLYYSVVAGNLLYLSLGCVTAWPSASIAHLKENGLTSSQETWMVSLSMLGSVFGPTVYGLCIDRFGRKYLLLLVDVVYIICWIILACGSGHPYALFVGRFIAGLANGVTINTVPIYVTEIADVNTRQTLASVGGLFISLGLLIEYGAGPWLSYDIMILLSALPALLFAAAWLRIKESPYHLVAKGKSAEAADVLIWLRGPRYDVSTEINKIEDMVTELKNRTGRMLDLILKKGPRNALLLSSLMLFIQPFSGVDVIASYLDPLLSETSLAISHSSATTIIGAINCFFALCEPLVVHRFGSKWVMIVCSFMCSISMLCFGIYKYFDERHYNMASVSAFPIICIISFELFQGLGYGNLPWAISAELYPPSLKGFGINIVTTMNCIMAFVSITIFGDLSPLVGVSSCFIGFAIFFVLGDILIAVVLPNTKGLSLDVIQEMLNKK